MPMDETIGEVAENTGEEQAERDKSPGIPRGPPEEQQGDDDERNAGERDEKTVVISKRAECGAGVSDMNEREKALDNGARRGGIDKAQNEKFCQLIKSVKRQGKEEEDFQNRGE